MVIGMIVLVVWGIVFQAPHRGAGQPRAHAQPSKAPWYFLGLQEMLVYFDPWLAGVVFPSLIIVGLMAIPYIDTNPKGNGYFTFKERKVEITLFLFGFLILWVLLVILGTFLRGPNWNFFGPYEYWDLHKLEALVNVNLSEYFWVKMLHTKMPRGRWTCRARAARDPARPLLHRRAAGDPGHAADRIAGACTIGLKKYYEKLGPWRYAIFVMLLLSMIALPIKMVLRWTLQPEVHRGPARDLLQYLAALWHLPRSSPDATREMADRARKLNVVFALTSIALLIVFSLMIWADYDRDWKKYQKEFTKLEVKRTEEQIQEAQGKVDAAQAQELEERDRPGASRRGRAARRRSRRREDELDKLDGEWYARRPGLPLHQGQDRRRPLRLRGGARTRNHAARARRRSGSTTSRSSWAKLRA